MTLWLPLLSRTEDYTRQHGTIVKMRMVDCVFIGHGVMAALSGTGRVQTGELCPEYVLLTDKVVFTIMGKSSTDFLPLAEVTNFRFQKNQLLIRIDDAKRESHFEIKAMMVRAEWDRLRQLETPEEEADGQPWHHLDSTRGPQDHP